MAPRTRTRAPLTRERVLRAAPNVADTVSPFLMAATLAELWMVGYLLVIGVRTPRAARTAPVAV